MSNDSDPFDVIYRILTMWSKGALTPEQLEYCDADWVLKTADDIVGASKSSE